jgi:putative membrane protein
MMPAMVHLGGGPPMAHVGGAVEHPLQGMLLVFVALAYWRRALTLSRRGHPVPAIRLLAFAAGIALALASLTSPLAHLGEELVWAHMAQHLLLADIAALLVVLGLTGPLLQPLLSIRPIYRLRALAHPAVALPLWAVNLYMWHLPGLYQAAVANPALHALEHISFFGFGLLMWMPLLGPLPRPAWFGDLGRLAYVLCVRVAGAALANVLLFSSAVLYPDYAPAERAWDIGAVTDQQIAGGVMLAEGSLVTLALLAWLLVRTMRAQEEAQGLVDLALSRGIALEPRRARRAVSGGWSEALRERILRPEDATETPMAPPPSARAT